MLHVALALVRAAEPQFAPALARAAEPPHCAGDELRGSANVMLNSRSTHSMGTLYLCIGYVIPILQGAVAR